MSLTRSKPSQTDTEQRADLTVAELFADYTATIRELRRRRVIRTQNAPAGDYAEYLVQRAFGGTIAPNSQKSWDVVAANGDRLQVKCRVVSDPIKPSERQLGILRSFDFDAVVVVHLNATVYSVRLGLHVPVHTVRQRAIRNERQNGTTLFVTPGLINDSDTSDVTERLAAGR